MQKSKLTRRALALRLFAGAALVNALLLLIFWPAPTPVESPRAQRSGVEMKIRAALHTEFVVGKQVLLSHARGVPVGAVHLLRLEEDNVVVALSEKIYRQHHRALIHEQWALIPYINGIESRPRPKGTNYEIAY
jgi:hypothetical protein